jgi:hypothetical protein
MSEEQKHAADDREEREGSSDEDESEESDDDDDDEDDDDEDEDDGAVDEADEKGETRDQEMARLIREANQEPSPSTASQPTTSTSRTEEEDEEEGDDLAPLPTTSDAPPSPTSMPVLASAFQKVTFTTRPPPSQAPSTRSLLPGSEDIRNTVTSEMVRSRAQSAAKHHSRVAPGKMGSAKTTKRKNEGKARLMKQERSGANDDW